MAPADGIVPSKLIGSGLNWPTAASVNGPTKTLSNAKAPVVRSVFAIFALFDVAERGADQSSGDLDLVA